MEEKNKYCVDCEHYQDKIDSHGKREGVHRCQAEFSDHKGKARLPFDDACPEWKEVRGT